MIKEVTDLSSPELALFSQLTEGQLRRRQEPEQGIFIAESEKVISYAGRSRFTPGKVRCWKV